MNKITKILALWLALSALLFALHTSAATWDAKQKLSLKINAKDNSCTMSDYNLGSFEVQDTDRVIPLTGASLVKCELRENAAKKLSLQLLTWLTDLNITSEFKTIDKSKFNYEITNIWVKWSLTSPSSTSMNGTFASPAILYNKSAEKIGIWTWTLKVWWTIPWWQPSGTYTWELNLLIQVPAS